MKTFVNVALIVAIVIFVSLGFLSEVSRGGKIVQSGGQYPTEWWIPTVILIVLLAYNFLREEGGGDDKGKDH